MSDAAEIFSKPIYLGSALQPLVYLEVEPLQLDDAHITANSSPELISAFVKLQFMKTTFSSALESQRPILGVRWDGQEKFLNAKDSTPSRSSPSLRSGILFTVSQSGKEHPIVFLEQTNPLILRRVWPCRCRVYSLNDALSRFSPQSQSRFVVTEATLVRVLPLQSNIQESWKGQLTGELREHSKSSIRGVFHTQNPEVIYELKMRMKQLLLRAVTIGTTEDAYYLEKNRRKRISNIQASVQNYMKKATTIKPSAVDNKETLDNRLGDYSTINLFQQSCLILHSPDHCAGKTALVETIARNICDVVHIIRPGPILAKYGVNGDAALETIIHEIILAAAIKRQSIGIVLDHLESFVPASLSAAIDEPGDAANPILNASRAYLRKLTSRLQQHGDVPFPTKNPLYNLQGKGGCVLPVRLCLVAVVTCPDDGFRSQIRRMGSSGVNESISTIFDSLIAGRYRLPDLKASTRLQAFLWAFREEKLQLETELELQLPFIAASAVWARGPAFQSVVRQVRTRIESFSNVATLAIFLSVLNTYGSTQKSGSAVQFLARNDVNKSDELFSSVGGNKESKSALEDALGIHPNRMQLILSIGLSLPTGILLYGPPGTGKTLIAKCVAQLLRSGHTSRSSVGGAFISVQSTDVAQAELGTGEKMLVDAFETARRNTPSVIFIDEFQALFTDRSSGGSGRLSTTLFQCIDNINQWQRLNSGDNLISENTGDCRVLVLAATNTPWMVDKAFLRPGRFDRAVHVGLPGYDDRKSIFHLYIRKMKTSFGNDSSKIDELCDYLSNMTSGYSGADIASLCRAAAVRCLLSKAECLREQHFYDTVRDNRGPSSNKVLVEEIEQWRP